MKLFPFLLIAAASLLASPGSSRGDLVLHASLDNADVGSGAGTDTTANGAFDVRDTAGPTFENGVAANNTGGATAAVHINAGLTGQIGGALNFGTYAGSNTNTSNGGVRFGDVLDIGIGSYTVSLWMYPTDTVLQYVASKGNAGSTNVGWSMFIETAAGSTFLRYRLGGAEGSTSNRASQSIQFSTLNTWYHLAMVIDNTAGSVTAYLNGSNAGAVNGGGGPTTNIFTAGSNIDSTFTLALGVRTSDNGVEFKGGLDDFGIFNTALSAPQINAIYQNGLVGIAVPEPSSALLLLGGVGFLAHRRRR